MVTANRITVGTPAGQHNIKVVLDRKEADVLRAHRERSSPKPVARDILEVAGTSWLASFVAVTGLGITGLSAYMGVGALKDGAGESVIASAVAAGLGLGIVKLGVDFARNRDALVDEHARLGIERNDETAEWHHRMEPVNAVIADRLNALRKSVYVIPPTLVFGGAVLGEANASLVALEVALAAWFATQAQSTLSKARSALAAGLGDEATNKPAWQSLTSPQPHAPARAPD